jgi:hypothetical protein
MKIPELSYAHLVHLSMPDGLYEHARFNNPRRDHGYCLDDVARALVVTARQPEPTDEIVGWSGVYLDFALAAQDQRGASHNRRDEGGPWTDEASTDDHWGRSLWGLGVTVSSSPDESMRERALVGAELAMKARSRWTRSMAYACLGAAEILTVFPDHRASTQLLQDARVMLGRPSPDANWPWPEPRLTYANAVLPEAWLAIGKGLDDDAALADGISVLTWLVAQQTRGTHLSVTPASGWAAGEPLPSFDQQPIEVSALAEASWRAFQITHSPDWTYVLDRCLAWFLGWNDAGKALYDPTTGGGYDGLLESGVNLNEGAESTLAALATFQLARLAPLQPAL